MSVITLTLYVNVVRSCVHEHTPRWPTCHEHDETNLHESPAEAMIYTHCFQLTLRCQQAMVSPPTNLSLSCSHMKVSWDLIAWVLITLNSPKLYNIITINQKAHIRLLVESTFLERYINKAFLFKLYNCLKLEFENLLWNKHFV